MNRFAFLIIIALVGGAHAEQPVNVNVISEVWPLDPFTLTDHRGTPFTLEQLQGRWTFMVFGYTRCKDRCGGGALSALRDMQNRIKQAAAAQNTQVLFISLDPERDTPQALDNYIKPFGERFIAGSGSAQTLRQLATGLGVSYRVVKEKDDAYRMEHSATVSLIAPDGTLRAEFSPPFDATRLTAEYLTIRNCPESAPGFFSSQ